MSRNTKRRRRSRIQKGGTRAGDKQLEEEQQQRTRWRSRSKRKR